METKDKELLLKDLCARLPYGVKVEITHWRNRDKGMIDSKIHRFPLDINKASVLIKPTSDVRPYLFPMSSMTDEQKEEMRSFDPFQTEETKTLGQWAFHLVDFYNKYHFDYRGLIEKGLAIDATGLGIY